MSGTTVSVKLSKDTESAIIQYATRTQSLLMTNFNLRTVLQRIDLAYSREENMSEENRIAKAFNRAGDATKLQDITVPIVMPQVEAALNYFVEVFLTGEPIFPVNSTSDNEDTAKQIQAIMKDNQKIANWKRQLIMFFRDGLKYNLHAIEVVWDQETLPGIETDVAFPNSAKAKQINWQGNKIKRIDLYNAFFDPRVHPADIYKEGEFAGYNEFYSRTKLKQYLNSLGTDIPSYLITRAMESSFTGSPTNSAGYAPFSYFTPIINPNPLLANDRNNTVNFDWMSWVSPKGGTKTGINYGNGYIVTVMYARILPSDFGFGVPAANTPQVWKFIIVNGSVVVKAEKLSNVHGYLPILFGQPIEDGLDYQTKSFATNVEDCQSIASGFWSMYLASKRRLIGDRVLFDPMRIREKDINNTSPAAKIPVRPAAMGTAVRDAVFQFPYHDEATESLINGAKMVTDLSNLVNGQNPAQQGQFVKGNKTLHEYDDVMGHGNGRNMAMAIMTETQVFEPAKKIILLNILQFQPPASLPSANPSSNIPNTPNTSVNIDPTELRKAELSFQISDGLTPTEKLMNTGTWNTAVQAIASSPQIGSGYNLAPMFSYIMKQQDVDLTPFEKPQAQVEYEQQLQAWQQAAAMAAQKGTAFNTPMPQSPAQVAQAQQAAAQAAPPGQQLAAPQSPLGNT